MLKYTTLFLTVTVIIQRMIKYDAKRAFPMKQKLFSALAKIYNIILGSDSNNKMNDKI